MSDLLAAYSADRGSASWASSRARRVTRASAAAGSSITATSITRGSWPSPTSRPPGSGARWPARVVAVAAAGVIGVVGFAVAGGYAVEGYTDLVWAAFAVGAVIWGLVLPRSPQALAVACICAAAASLTKNEGSPPR
jgi:hypothetical protein